jgi:hypothetical protein
VIKYPGDSLSPPSRTTTTAAGTVSFNMR